MINEKIFDKRIRLEELISQMLHIIKYNKDQVEQVKEILLKGGILKGYTQKIINGNELLCKLNNKLILMLGTAISNVTGEKSLKPCNYFTQEEIEEIFKESNVSSDISEKITFPFVIGNALKISDSEYISTIMLEFVEKLYNSNVLRYNYTQGNYKFKKNIAGELNKAIVINQGVISKTVDEIIETESYDKTIVINVMNKTGKEISYNSKTKELTIHQSDLFIADGLHDIYALMEVIKLKPDLKIDIQLGIKHFDEHKMKYLINKLKLRGGAS